VAFLLTALVIAVLYFVGYQTPAGHGLSPGWRASIRAALQMATMCFGQGSVHYWPTTGMVVLALLVMTVGLALFVYRKQPEERPRVIGVLALLAGLSCLMLVTGWGRAFIGPTAGFASRYVTLAIPALCCIYLAWGLYGGPNTGRTVQMCLFSLACAFYLPNVEDAIEVGRSRRQRFAAFEQELLLGVDSRSLSERHAPFLLNDKGYLDVQMRSLHHAGIGIFRHLNPFPSRVTNLDSNPYSFAMMRTPPILAQSEISVSVGFCHDRNVLGVHAPGELHFQLPRGSHRILGEFGIAPGAYEQGQTDGVLFTVECLSDNSTPVILYERHLDPLHESRDRGLQTLRLDLPEGMEGRLIFRTSNKPGHNTGWDWSYWTGIEIQ
jgi:hypothetical protein